MKSTSNYQKHTTKNPVQRFLIENFYNNLISTLCDLDLGSVLDVACGEGFTLARLQKNRIGRKLEGVDFSNDAIRMGREMFPNLSLKYGNIYNLPYKKGSFDLVICTEALEHLEKPDIALVELRRVSKKYLLLSVPNEPLFRLANFLRGKNLSRFGNDIEHINHWSSNSFEKFIKNNGIKILIKKVPFPWILVLAKKK